MNKVMMVVGAVALAGVMSGCVTGGAAGEDKVAAWQKDRTPVEVLKSKIEVKAAGAIVEALDVPVFGIYKAVADKVDGMAIEDRYRRIYLGYVADVQEMEKNGKTHDEAIKAEMDQLRAMEGGEEIIANLHKYLEQTKKTNFQALLDWATKIGQDLQAAGQTFAQESPKALQQLLDIAQKEGGMAIMKIPSQGKDDLAVIGEQLADSGKGLALYIEMVNADKEAAKVQADYPVEG